eukprot:362180-Chlamydomonas_euryale.AAC.2
MPHAVTASVAKPLCVAAGDAHGGCDARGGAGLGRAGVQVWRSMGRHGAPAGLFQRHSGAGRKKGGALALRG